MKLLEPVRLANLELRNRIVFPPIASSYGTGDGFVTDAMISYYKSIAKNCGLCIVEAVCVDWEGRVVPRQLWICDDKFSAGLELLAEAIHSMGAKVAIQIVHAGIVAYFSGVEKVWGPSKAPYPIWDPTVVERIQELTTEQVETIIEEFAQGALRAKQCGYDAVEIHGAHGYLINQFLSPEINKRTDRFGGDLAGRMRLPIEIVRRTKAAVGKDFPLMYRMNGDDMIEEAHRLQWHTDTVGFRLEEGKILAKKLEESGVDIIHVSAGTYDALVWESQPSDFPHGCLTDMAAAIKKSVSVPVIAVGRIVTPAIGEKILREGKADLIAIGRGLVADDEWLEKATQGRSDEIQQCIGCMECMRKSIFTGQELCCTVNYKVSREETFALKPVAKKKKIMIVGGGPAGMTAARYAAARGHDVTLYEKESRLGGLWHYAAMVPGCQDYANYTKRCSGWLKKLNVKVELSREVAVELVEEQKPDVVIVATGSAPTTPSILGITGSNVVADLDVLSGKSQSGQNVVVWCSTSCCNDFSYHGCRTADYLAAREKNVSIVSTKRLLVDTMMPHCSGPMYWRFAKAKVQMLTETKLKEITGSEVVVEGQEGARRLPADTVVLANVLKPNNRLAKALEGKVPHLVTIGDATEVSNCLHANDDGARVGLEI